MQLNIFSKSINRFSSYVQLFFPLFIFTSQNRKRSIVGKKKKKKSHAQPTTLAAPSVKWAGDGGELRH